MKILYIIEQLEKGGAEVVVKTLSNALIKENYEITILSFSENQNIFFDEGINVINFGEPPFFIKNKRINFSLKRMNKFREIVNQISPDIIHSHINNHKIANLLLTKKSNIKYITTIHTFCTHYKHKNSLNWLIEKCTNRLLNMHIVTISPEIQEHFVSYLQIKKCNLITNGVSTKLVSTKKDLLRDKLDIKQEDYIAIHVGRFHDVKDHITILKAVAIVREYIPNFKVIFLGGRGNVSEEIFNQIELLKLNDIVCCLGEVENVKEYLSIADLGVFPSKQEGLSIALLEMMACKLPVIVTNIPSFKYMYQEINNTQEIEIADYKSLADKIIYIYNNKIIAEKLGEDSRAKVISEFSETKQISSHINLYNGK